jgi:hypothetical protein
VDNLSHFATKEGAATYSKDFFKKYLSIILANLTLIIFRNVEIFKNYFFQIKKNIVKENNEEYYCIC